MSDRRDGERRGARVHGVVLRIAVALVVCILVPAVVPGQNLAEADWFERELGAGVAWRHYLFDDLFGSTQSVSYVEVDLGNPDVSVGFPYLASARQRVSSMIPSQVVEPVAGINGTYFDTSVGGHRTYLRVGGTEIPPGSELFSPWGYEGALALDVSGGPAVEEMPAGGWAYDTAHPDIMGCGPLLIVVGVIPSAHFGSIGSHCTSRHPRSAVGVTPDDRLILLTVDGRTELAAGMTCQELAEVMWELGCMDALNLDGGGSTTLWGEGEPYNGVLNFPSDNGFYDRAGERSCSNAIAVESTPPSPREWDGRVTGKVFSPIMDPGALQTVRLVYVNIGTATWSDADTGIVVARPATRASVFRDAATWPSPSQPAFMSPSTVGPGESAVFDFVLTAPEVSRTTVYDEHFMLIRAGSGRFGPSDSEAWMRLVVQPPLAPGETFLVESRIGGHNSAWYSDSGMANSSASCTAPGCTAGIGGRYGSTYRSVAGLKRATVAPDFPEAGLYKVYVAWGAGNSRRTPITYHVAHARGADTFHVDQTAVANTWVQLGTAAFLFEPGRGGRVEMTNEDIDISGSMFAGAVKFEYQEAAEEPEKVYAVRRLEAADPRPVIDGGLGMGEWDAATAAGTGFAAHDQPLTPAAEAGSFRMLYDDSDLYILFRMNAAYLAGYPTPPSGYGFGDLKGDRVNFYLTPGGVNSQAFYRILFSPNPSDGRCYVWSQASRVKTFDAFAGTDWVAGGEAAYTHIGGVLTIEYRIPWAAFNYAGMSVAGCPEDGETWGVQPAVSNEIAAGVWEYVNWEPDDTPGYVFGEPFGGLFFGTGFDGACEWGVY